MSNYYPEHDDPAHVYSPRRNPSGCDRFYCLQRFRPWWYRWFMLRHPGQRMSNRQVVIIGVAIMLIMIALAMAGYIDMTGDYADADNDCAGYGPVTST